MAKQLNARAAAAKLSWQIIDKGQSLDAVLSDYFTADPNAERGLIQEIVYGVCRWYGELDAIAGQLLGKPIRNKDRVVHFLLLVGLYQLKHLQTAEHAAVSETVAGSKQLNKVWAKNLINGCLRRWQREAPELTPASDSLNALTHPDWLIDKLTQSWPKYADQILTANNQRPPMLLRVNQRVSNREDYLQKLEKAEIGASADPRSHSAIRLTTPVPVSQLPGFSDGVVSVQDIAAQIATECLDLQAGQSVLDACAAPGGKAAHLLERCDNQLQLQALDVSAARADKLRETFTRLKLSANTFVADAAEKPSWPTPEEGYDHVLIDAPCTGTGVIRRHPDIKHHRRAEDVESLRLTQARLLANLWPLVKPEGQLLYMTCSVLPEENEEQISSFLDTQSNIEVVPISHPQALQLQYGCQTLTGVHDMDGFFSCLMRKIAV